MSTLVPTAGAVRPRRPSRPIRPVKLAGWLLVLAPAVLMAANWAAGALGARPINHLIHSTGFWAIRLLLLALAVTPLRFSFGWKEAPTLRRLLGVAASCYAAAHLALYVVQQNGRLVVVVHEITHRVYLAIGFVALLGLLVLAFTSTDASVKRLGKRWKTLHRLVFPLVTLGLLHFFMQSKIDVGSATVYAGLFLFLLTWRALPRRWSSRPLVIGALALLGALLTAEVEAGWFALATPIDPARVLHAELVFRFGPRPAMRVLLLGLLVTAASAALWLFRRWRDGEASQHAPPRKRHAAGLN